MPIRAENRERYPDNWPILSAAVRARANGRCEFCRVRNGALGGRLPDGRFVRALPLGERLLRLEWPKPGSFAWCEGGHHLRIVRIVLTVAHLDHQPENCAPENLKALCQRCHNRHDAPHRAAEAKTHRRAELETGDLFCD